MEIRIQGICKESSVDGQGLRYVVFTQGCRHHCPGCHNPETHNFDGGHLKDVDSIIKELSRNKLVRGLTISGGDPMEQPEAVLELAQKAKQIGKTVWVYTGYTYEELVEKNNETIFDIIKTIDVLIDGRYIAELNKGEGIMRYKGSSNQRVIDCKKTVESGSIKIYYC